MTRELFNYPTTPITDGWASFDDLAADVSESFEIPRTDYTILREVELGDAVAAFILDMERDIAAAVA